MGQAVARGRLEHIDAVNEEVFRPSLGNDAGEAIGQHTGEGASKEEGAETDEEEHERRAEDGVNVVHNLDTGSARAEEDFSKNHGHIRKGKRVSPDEGEGSKETAVDDDDQNHKFDKVFAHLLEAGNQCAPVRAQAKERADSRHHEQSFQGEYVKGNFDCLLVMRGDTNYLCEGRLVNRPPTPRRVNVEKEQEGNNSLSIAKVIPRLIMIMSNTFQRSEV